jgi:NAD(P)H-dependent flavin oxidoreductase YrpB (nitropropane dioxygenase family)
VSIPIVAAGGIATRAQVRDALSIGADAVRIGTRFVATRESGAHPSYKAALVAARPGDSVLTDAFAIGWPDAPHRVLRHALKAASDRDPRTPVAHLELGQRRIPLPLWSVTPPSAAVTGDIDATAMYAGTAADTITDLPPAANVVADLAGAS